ncbi:MAG: LemA family protein [Deltaproteobacteria bacterium]|jgi:LemA protein|nr:LemA family protein [Deltaproteobacteria bacterium]
MGILIAVGASLGAALLVAVWAIKVKNRFRRLIVKIGEGDSGVDVALTKRYDTLTKMLEVCRQYAAHEVETFAKVIELRRGMSMPERQAASGQMDDMAARLNVVAEQYPELRSSEVFRELQGGIRDAEEHLQAARRLYNANVSAFNQLLVTWPYSKLGQEFEPYAFFEAEAAKRADVSMKL